MIRQILYSTTYPKISQIREPRLSKVGRGLHAVPHIVNEIPLLRYSMKIFM